MAWPKLEAEWPHGLEAVRNEVAQLIRQISQGEELRLLVDPDEELPTDVEAKVVRVDLHYGDIWTRDSVPIRLSDGTLVKHRFNGWGEKYLFDGDDRLVGAIAEHEGGDSRELPLTLEGGGLEFDGAGRCLVTRSSLLNDNRNPGVTESDASALLKEAYGTQQILWLDGALENDHTDGHIDTLARFVAPGVVVCAEPNAAKPNHEALKSILSGLEQLRGQGLLEAVHTLPAPEAIEGAEGELLATSHLNFYIANHAVIMPAYGIPSDALAERVLSSLFTDRPVVTSPAREILEGGGALHCITRDWPVPAARATKIA